MPSRLTSPSIPEKLFSAHYILLIFVLSIILSLSASFWVISSDLPLVHYFSLYLPVLNLLQIPSVEVF